MPSIVKVLGPEVSIDSANTVSDSKLVRLYAPEDTLVTIEDSDTNVVGTMTIPSGRVEYVEKRTTDTIAANNAVLCVPVSYNT
jgi:hypothetical protein